MGLSVGVPKTIHVQCAGEYVRMCVCVCACVCACVCVCVGGGGGGISTMGG